MKRLTFVVPLMFLWSTPIFAASDECQEYMSTIQLLKDDEVYSDEMKERIRKVQDSAIEAMTSKTRTNSDNVVDALEAATKATQTINEMFPLFSDLLPHIKFRTTTDQILFDFLNRMATAFATTTVVKHRLMYETTCGELTEMPSTNVTLVNVLRAVSLLLVEIDRTEPELRTTDHLIARFSLYLRQNTAPKDQYQEMHDEENDLPGYVRQLFLELLREAQDAGHN